MNRRAFTLVETLILSAILFFIVAGIYSCRKEKERKASREAARAGKVETSKPITKKPVDVNDASQYQIITDGERFSFVFPNGMTNVWTSFATCDQARLGIERIIWNLKNASSVPQPPPLTGFTNAICR